MKTPQELRDDIQETLPEISKLIEQITQATSESEKKPLRRQLRGLQYLQLWRVGLLRSMGEEIWNK